MIALAPHCLYSRSLTYTCDLYSLYRTQQVDGSENSSKCAAVMAMSYASGAPLSKLIAHGGAFSKGVGLAVMAQLIDAVAYLHGRAICHRDIKPANIVVTCPSRPQIWNGADDHEKPVLLLLKYNVTLVDFGFARALSPEDLDDDIVEVDRRAPAPLPCASPEARISVSHIMIRKMSALGTRLYGAPEIFDNPYENNSTTFVGDSEFLSFSDMDLTKTISPVVSSYGMLADAYALGNTFKHMMTGVRPNLDDTKVVNKMRSPMNKLGKWMSSRGCGSSCVANPKYKYRTLSELPSPMARLIHRTCKAEASERLSIRACRRSPLITSILGEAPDSNEIDFLPFARKETGQERSRPLRKGRQWRAFW